jgi:acyl dehydratase
VTSRPGTPRLVEPFGLDVRIVTQARTITAGDFAAIVNASWAGNPMHSDAERARDTVYGKPILGGPFLIAIAAGLSIGPLHTSWYAAGYDVYAALGIDEVRYMTPVGIDDTVHLEIGVSDFEPTKKGSAMFCRLDEVMKNQRGEPVLTMHRSYLLKGLSD